MAAVRISDEVLGELEQICEQRQFNPGEVITVKGEQHKSMFFILTGRLIPLLPARLNMDPRASTVSAGKPLR